MDDIWKFAVYFLGCCAFIVWGVMDLYTYKTVKPTTFTVIKVDKTWRGSDNDGRAYYYENIILEDSDKRQYEYCYKANSQSNLPELGQTLNHLYLIRGIVKEGPSVLGSVISVISILAGFAGIIVPNYLIYQELKKT